ncbi:MAG: hypothetical protein CME59_06785 [Halioglobus sp.]|mgnify:CR=1 FL=1|nr:hypothetical protein [Halioglobus sp.]
MYEVFYNLKAEPFRLSPDHRFCYEHKGYARARAYMAYAFMRAEGFVMITGRPGTGKTTLIGELVESLARDNVHTANLVCTQLQADDLLRTVAYSFGVGADGVDKAELLQRLNVQFHRWHRDGRRALLIVDEAQDLSPSAMEELRLLTNIQQNGQPLLQIFLLGQPELRDLVLSPEMEQVHQRIVAASHLDGLEEDEVETYVLHRLRKVGWRGDPAISRGVFPLLHKFSEGVPRRINLICSRLFLHGGVEQRHAIEIDDVRVVISELQAENLAAGTRITEDDFASARHTGWAEVPRDPAEATVAPAEPPPQPQPPPAEDKPRAGVRLRAVGGETAGHGDAPRPPSSEGPAKKKEVSPARPQTRPTGTAAEARAVPLREADTDTTPDPRLAAEPRDDVAPVDFPPADPAPANDPVQAASAGRATDGTARPAAAAARAGGPRSAHRAASSRRTATLIAFALILLLGLAGVFLPPLLLDNSDPWSDPDNLLPPREEFEPLGETTPEATPPAQESGDPASPANAAAEAPAAPATVGESAAAIAGAGALDEQADAVEPGAARYDGGVSSTPAAGQGVPPLAGETPPRASTADADGDVAPLDVPASPAPAAAEPAAGDLTLLVRFSFDSAELDERAMAVLDEAGRIMARETGSRATITGYSDSVGEDTYNVDLSLQRARAVERYLAAAGLAAGRLEVAQGGFPSSADYPAADGRGTDMAPQRIVRITIDRGGERE